MRRGMELLSYALSRCTSSSLPDSPTGEDDSPLPPLPSTDPMRGRAAPQGASATMWGASDRRRSSRKSKKPSSSPYLGAVDYSSESFNKIPGIASLFNSPNSSAAPSPLVAPACSSGGVEPSPLILSRKTDYARDFALRDFAPQDRQAPPFRRDSKNDGSSSTLHSIVQGI